MLADDNDEMIQFLRCHQQDIQYTGPNGKPWRFEGAWHSNGKIPNANRFGRRVGI